MQLGAADLAGNACAWQVTGHRRVPDADVALHQTTLRSAT
jgi:hypothetical protein